jgi:rsbT co-antagonist protein RsbR
MVERERARKVIFDITGVPLVDTRVAQVLLQTAAAVRLLGAQPLLVGIRPEVAQTIISLGLDFEAITTYSNLQEAVEALLPERAGLSVN